MRIEPGLRTAQPDHGERLARRSLWMLALVPVGIFLSIVWSNIVKTSPTLDEATRVRGWESVVRDLPATLFLLAVIAIGMTIAVRAGREGATAAAKRAIRWHGIALFLILVILLGAGADNVMTTRSATVKWLLFPLEIGIPVLAVVVAGHAARHRDTR